MKMFRSCWPHEKNKNKSVSERDKNQNGCQSANSKSKSQRAAKWRGHVQDFNLSWLIENHAGLFLFLFIGS